MEAEINSIRHNPLLERNEIEVNLEHEGESTPSKEDVKDRIAAEEDIDPEEIEVVNVKSAFGRQKSTAYLKVFETLDLEDYGEEVEETPVEREEETEEAGETEDSESTGYEETVSGTINEAKDQLQSMDKPDYEAALQAEKSNKNRTTLIDWLESKKE
ncbi:MAG: hypothetical protein BRC27_01055 [Nanohaloarchaea archaeon SW_10_44_10]|nr:MAG: hypothetical protein BRC27_01055 [Nanohaloarchaea archaeon SW_10_44_10]